MIRSGRRGSARAAVPMPTSDAPDSRYALTSAAERTPPVPITGSPVRSTTLRTASNPAGSSSGPLMPPLPFPRRGLDPSSYRNPGSVLITDIASAPASRAATAMPAMSARAGDSFTESGRLVTARQPDTTAATDDASAPNSMPPALVLGQDRLSSYSAMPSSWSRPATTSAYSSTVKPTTLTSTRHLRTLLSSAGRCVLRTAASPGLARPTALSIPPANSPTRGGGLPARGSRETALTTMPPSRSSSMTPASSVP